MYEALGELAEIITAQEKESVTTESRYAATNEAVVTLHHYAVAAMRGVGDDADTIVSKLQVRCRDSFSVTKGYVNYCLL